MVPLFQPSWAVSSHIQAAHLDSLRLSLIFTLSSDAESVLEHLTTLPLAVFVGSGNGLWSVRQESPATTSLQAKTLCLFAEVCADIWQSTSQKELEGMLAAGQHLLGFLVPIRSFPD